MNHDIHLVNKDALRTAQTIMRDKFYKIIHYYFEDTEAYIQAIEQGVSAKNAATVVPAAHTIKSSSKQIGVDYVSHIAMEIELLGKDVVHGRDRWQEIADKTRDMKRIYLLSRSQLESSLKEMIQ